ncbi:hypothetical protein T484DRAFT_1805954 [Baffinella frigidus]|nr:hypothetical protein T484DRAFT_1805954 [Cryptophyta sp. CCMP2293]
MGENDVCIGVDGGGTKTTAVVIASAGGDVLGQGGSGSTNKNSVGEAVATSSFKSAIADALKAAGRTVEDVVCLAVGMSGCDTDADVVLWRGICESVAPNARAIVENDAVMALCSGTGGVLEGVVVISGTGSIAFGAAPGRPRAALNAVTFASDGRGPPTPLTRLVLDFCKVTRAP